MTDSAPQAEEIPSLWSSSLVLGIPLIDGQHRNLVERLEALLRAIRAGQTAHQLRQSLDFITRYTQEHFQTEEHYMMLHGYPGLSSHQHMHQVFRATVAKAARYIETNPGSGQCLKLVQSLMINWYSSHITGADQEYVAFFRERGVSVTIQ